MILDAGSRFLVARRDLRTVRIAPDSDAPASRPLAEGQARLSIVHFALTANNITYAAFGEAMNYWRFFPTEEADWGCIPVWGFATVAESRAAGVEVGQRFFGYLPMGTHLVVQPTRVGPAGFVDGATRRAELATTYNRYVACASDPGYDPMLESQQAILWPLFTTSFLIDDFLAENDFFGARQVLLSSASSKTAYGTAFCLAGRGEGAPRVVGLTSPGNRAFTRSLGCYHEVLSYDELPTLAADVPSVYVDFAGNAALRRQIHERFADKLAYSCSVGGTHWDELGGGAGLPGPRPTLFFAPAQVKKRSAPPPEGWGGAGLQKRLAEAWLAFMKPVTSDGAWLEVSHERGATAVEAAYRRVLDGRIDAREGLMLSM